MTTEIAEAIIDGHGNDTGVSFGFKETHVPAVAARNMAAMWLMKTECMSALHFIIDTTPDGFTVKENATEWLAQLEGLDRLNAD